MERAVVDARAEADQVVVIEARVWRFFRRHNHGTQNVGDSFGNLGGVVMVHGLGDHERFGRRHDGAPGERTGLAETKI